MFLTKQPPTNTLSSTLVGEVATIRAVLDRFHGNSLGFVQSHRWFLLFFCVALLCDAASTTYYMLRWNLGPENDLHPMIRFYATHFGPVYGPFIGAYAKAFAAIVLAIYLRPWAQYILSVPAVIYLFAAWYNIWGLGYQESLISFMGNRLPIL